MRLVISIARITILAILLFVGKPGFSADLRLMTFNIKGDTIGFDPARSWNLVDLSDPNAPTFGPNRSLRAINVIDEYDPDILSVQELKLNQRNDLLEAFPGMSYYGQGRRGGVDDDANGIYFRTERFNLIDQGDFWLSETPDVPGTTFVGNGGDTGNPRMATWVKLGDRRNGQEYFVLSTHWSLDSQARRDSAALIQSKLPALAGELPILVLGDLNATRFSTAYRTIRGMEDPQHIDLSDSFADAQGSDGRTFHNWQGGIGGTRIDHVFHSPDDFQAINAQIIRTSFENGYFPSDHYPVTVTLTVVPEPAAMSLMFVLMGSACQILRRQSRKPA